MSRNPWWGGELEMTETEPMFSGGDLPGGGTMFSHEEDSYIGSDGTKISNYTSRHQVSVGRPGSLKLGRQYDAGPGPNDPGWTGFGPKTEGVLPGDRVSWPGPRDSDLGFDMSDFTDPTSVS